MGLLEFRVLFSADGGGGVIGAGSHLRYPRPGSRYRQRCEFISAERRIGGVVLRVCGRQYRDGSTERGLEQKVAANTERTFHEERFVPVARP